MSITSLALTVKQSNQRPLHISRCSVTLARDHFEFVAHSPSTNSKNISSSTSSTKPQNDPFNTIVNPFSNSSHPERNFDNHHHHVGSCRPLEPPSDGPAFVVRLFFKDISKMEIFPEICQIIVSTSSPEHSAFVGPAAADSLSPEHRREFFENEGGDEFHGDDDEEENQPHSSGRDFFVTGGNSAALSLQQRLNNLIVSSPQQSKKNKFVSVGGTKRQYILIFNEDHVTEVWYKTMTQSVEEWTDKYAGGMLMKKKQQQNDNDEKGKNSNSNNDDLFVADDVLDIENAISNLDRDYYRDDLGWSSPKERRAYMQSMNRKGAFSRTEFNYGNDDERPPLSKAQQQREKEYQIRVSQTRRKLLPMWGNVETSRDEIVKSIAKKGVYPAVESAGSPRRENTLELVKQAKLMELRELERREEEKARLEEEGNEATKNIDNSTISMIRTPSRSPIPLLSAGSKPETARPLLSKEGDYYSDNENQKLKSDQSRTGSSSASLMNKKAPLLSTQSTVSRGPLLSTSDFYTTTTTKNKDLHQPIRPASQSQQNQASNSNSNNASRETTPPPRNPNMISVQQRNVSSTNNKPTSPIPLLSTSANYPSGNTSSSKLIPSDSTAVFPRSSEKSSAGKKKVVVVAAPPPPPPPPPPLLQKKSMMQLEAAPSSSPQK